MATGTRKCHLPEAVPTEKTDLEDWDASLGGRTDSAGDSGGESRACGGVPSRTGRWAVREAGPRDPEVTAHRCSVVLG